VTVKLGDWLVGKGKITREQLAKALQHQGFFGERLGNSLIKLGFIDEDALGEYLAEIAGTRYLPASRLASIGDDVIRTVPARLAAKYCIVPVAIEARKLQLAMREPRDLLAIDEIAFLTGLPIEPYVASEFRLIEAIERYYGIQVGPRTIPVAGAGRKASGSGAPPGPREVSPAPDVPAPEEVGLDGLPLDANPDDLDQPFMTSPAGAPPEHQGQEEPLPASLDAWRATQDPPPVAPPAATPGSATPTASATGARSAPFPTASSPTVSSPATAPPAPAGPVAEAVPAAPTPAPSRPVAVPAPLDMESIAQRLRESDTRDDVFSAVLDFASAQFRRSALFVVQQDRVLGWSGRGDGLFPSRIRNVIVPLDRPSLFVFFRSGADYYYGPVPDLPANAKFYLDLGCPPPARIMLVPLSIMERTSVILYGDNGPETGRGPDIQVFRRLLAKAALALEVLILRNKIMMI
jgi:hypothetical protein